MQLTIIAIGKKKSEYDTMIKEYQKRIVKPFSLDIEIIAPLGIDDPKKCRTQESEQLFSRTKNHDYVILLDELGRDFTTVAFSKLVEKELHQESKRIVFLIGGAYGIDPTFHQQAHLIMNLGKLTMPHELARLVLAEQLYRVTNLIAGGKYHHA